MAKLQPKKESIDIVIVGCGAGGGVIAKELGEAGLSVVVLEAGKRFDPAADYLTDQPGFALSALRVFEPDDPRRDLYSSGGAAGFSYTRVKGVGGSTLRYLAMTPRFHESDFRVRTEDGMADDWPLTYADLEPYYCRVEYELGVSGPAGAEANPFDSPRSKPFPMPPHELNCANRVIKRGAEKLGLHWIQCPLAIPTKPWGKRPACIRAGVCGHGCKIKAKSSIDVTYVPKAEATGRVEIRPRCQAREITLGQEGRARSVVYFDSSGKELEISARAVVVAGNAVETPRLLLLSTSNRYPNGLANSSGLVGKFFMEHLSVERQARFEQWLAPWEGPSGAAYLQDFYATNKGNNFVRGWQVETNSGWQWPSAVAFRNPGWGSQHKAKIKELVGHGVSLSGDGEQLPDMRNYVTLNPELKDHVGLPVPHIVNEPRENDKEMLKAIPKCLKEILQAAGAVEISDSVYVPGGSSHYLGTCRMGADPRTSVVDPWCRTHDIPNLFIGDGSVFVTCAAVNPALTIAALATRTAEAIIAAFKRGEL